jgi:hypothetical protein
MWWVACLPLVGDNYHSNLGFWLPVRAPSIREGLEAAGAASRLSSLH